MTLVLLIGAIGQQPATRRHGCDAARPLASRTSIAKGGGGGAHSDPVSKDRVEILRLGDVVPLDAELEQDLLGV
ncbi:MAG: hypothetical protein ABR885_18620, partial [Mycobacterium sp.]